MALSHSLESASPFRDEPLLSRSSRSEPAQASNKRQSVSIPSFDDVTQLPAPFVLVCTRGTEAGTRVEISFGSHTIGRARENAFVLKDIAASRRHARIEVAASGCQLIDLGSGNGTRVNGKRVAEHWLQHGDAIEVGASLLQFLDAERANGVATVAPTPERILFSGNGTEDAHQAHTQRISPKERERITAQLQQEAPRRARTDSAVHGKAPRQKARAQEAVTTTRLAASLPPTPAANERMNPWVAAALAVSVVLFLAAAGLFAMTQLKPLAPPATPVASPGAYDAQLAKAAEGTLAKDWTAVSEAAAAALALHPGDNAAMRYQARAREELALALKPTPPAPPPAPAVVVAAPPVVAEPEPVVVDIPVVAVPEPVVAAKPRPAAPRPKAVVRKAPAPAAPASDGLSDESAKDMFTEAIGLLRNEDNEEGCRLLREVAAQTTDTSRWQQKAAARVERSCQ